MSTSRSRFASDPSVVKRPLLPAPFAAFAFGSIALIPIMVRQPREVAAAVYAGYIAVMAIAAGVLFAKKKRKRMAVGAALTCVAFTGLGVLYGYLAYAAPR